MRHVTDRMRRRTDDVCAMWHCIDRQGSDVAALLRSETTWVPYPGYDDVTASYLYH